MLWPCWEGQDMLTKERDVQIDRKIKRWLRETQWERKQEEINKIKKRKERRRKKKEKRFFYSAEGRRYNRKKLR